MLNSTNIRKLFKEEEYEEYEEFVKLFNFFGYDKDSSEDELQSLAELLNGTYEYGCSSGFCEPLTYCSDSKEFYQQFEDQVDEYIENLCEELGWAVFQQTLMLETYDILGKTDCAINMYVWSYVEDLIGKMIATVAEE